MDAQKIQSLVASSQFAMAILENAQGEFALCHFGPDEAATQTALIAGGMRFAGAMGIMADGGVRCALAIPREENIVSALGSAFLARFEKVIKLVESDGAGVMWLNALHALPDTRN
jgi:hypothetical protein